MKRSRPVVFVFLCGVLVWLLYQSSVLRGAAQEAVDLCLKTVIPSLFPFLVVSSLLISLGFAQWISPHLAGLMTPLFRLGGAAGSALVLGFMGGYPIGVRTAAALYREGILLRGEAQRLLTFCSNASPVFFLAVAGPVFDPPRAGMALWLIHVLCALLCGLFFRGSGKGRTPPQSISLHTVTLPTAFVRSVTQGTTSMLCVCGFVVFFYVMCAPLRALGGPLGAAAVGMVELFSLTPLIKPDALGFVTVSACAAWGGVSVMCQCAAVLEESGLSIRPLLLGKALHALLCALAAAAVWPFL